VDSEDADVSRNLFVLQVKQLVACSLHRDCLLNRSKCDKGHITLCAEMQNSGVA
jgi:hypothetical protein